MTFEHAAVKPVSHFVREFLKVRTGGVAQVVDSRAAQAESDEGRAQQSQDDRSQGQACPQGGQHRRWGR